MIIILLVNNGLNFIFNFEQTYILVTEYQMLYIKTNIIFFNVNVDSKLLNYIYGFL